ncbi:ABC-three component system middle component 6 [Listeria seeligeri]|uniref:ABC-three component system middle component 6 n=1 Tax=Listeria seeligeri TaxID=1640 RepID=UPI0022EC12A7|nr:ABC-three component system middle component 6 [Listeria seeligeri]
MESILINLDAKPNDSIYYISACVLEEAQNTTNVDKLFNNLQSIYNKSLTYHDYMLSLNFLFLLGKISINERGDLVVYKKSDN